MTRDELNEMLATEPATRNQVGAIHREFERLGFREKDRAERLAVSAAMIELGSLGSTRDLTMGQAGCLVCLLLVTGERSELTAPGRPARGGVGRCVVGLVVLPRAGRPPAARPPPPAPPGPPQGRIMPGATVTA